MEYLLYAVRVIILISVLIGIFNYSYANRFFRFLSIQIFVYGGFTLFLLIQEYYCKSNNIPIFNIPYIYLHVGIEGAILFIAVRHIMINKVEKKLYYILFSTFILVFLYHVFYIGLQNPNDLADITSCICMTVIYSIALNHFISKNENKWWKSPEILSTLGILGYFACSVPYISLMKYLEKNEPKIDLILFYFINYGLANLRYLLLLISLIIIYRSRGKNQLVLEDGTFENKGIGMS